jgi:hypothetical protein
MMLYLFSLYLLIPQSVTDLQILRKNLTNYGKYFSKYPCDPRIRGHYYKLLREYNKVRKSKYRLYKSFLKEK